MPESLVHPVLGQLRWEPEYSWWLGEARFPSGVLGDLVVAPGEAGAAFLDTAAALYQQVIVAEPRIRLEATATGDGILDLYRHWRQGDDPEWTAEELTTQLEPTFLRIDTIVPVTVSYSLGERNEMFGGHAVDVELNNQLVVERVNLAG